MSNFETAAQLNALAAQGHIYPPEDAVTVHASRLYVDPQAVEAVRALGIQLEMSRLAPEGVRVIARDELERAIGTIGVRSLYETMHSYENARETDVIMR